MSAPMLRAPSPLQDRAEHSERIDADLATDEFARADKYERQYPDNPDLAEQTRAFARL